MISYSEDMTSMLIMSDVMAGTQISTGIDHFVHYVISGDIC